MQIDNIIKEIRRIQDFYHMSDTMAPHEMEKWLIDLSYDLLEYKQEVEEEDMIIRDERNDYMWLADDLQERVNSLEDQLDWLKGLSVYQLSEWKMGNISYD